MMDYRKIKNERQWKSSTGLNEEKFHQLAYYFGEKYEELNAVSISELSQNLGVNLLLKSYTDCLFFVLFQLKNGLCYDNLGLLIDTDGSNAQRNFEKYLHILEQVLDKQGVMPSRNFNNLADFKAKIGKNTEIIIDGVEHCTQRPKGYKIQKESYSGKKRDIRIKS